MVTSHGSTQHRASVTDHDIIFLYPPLLSLQVGREVTIVTTPCSSGLTMILFLCLCPPRPLSQCYRCRWDMCHPPKRVKKLIALVSDHDRTGILCPHFPVPYINLWTSYMNTSTIISSTNPEIFHQHF